jgi:tetratricopeptide (TPR) repeat protein
MGRVHQIGWNWKGAEQEIGRALELDPGNANVARNAYYLSNEFGNFDEGLRHAKAATELDPLNSNNYLRLGEAEFYVGNLAEADTAYRKALELQPELDGVHSGIASVLWKRGKLDEALAEAERESSAFLRELNVPFYLDVVGRKSEANRAFAVVEAKYAKSFPYVIGEIYASRSDLDRAFAWWDLAYRIHDTGLGGIKLAPIETGSKQLASDPRYKALLRKMNLPE